MMNSIEEKESYLNDRLQRTRKNAIISALQLYC